MLSSLGRSSAQLTMHSTLADVKEVMCAEGFSFPSSDVLTGDSCEETDDMTKNVQKNLPVYMDNVLFGEITLGFDINDIPDICVTWVRIPGICHFEFGMDCPVYSLDKLVEASLTNGLFAERNNYVSCGTKTQQLLQFIHQMHGQTFFNPGKPHEEFISIEGFASHIV